MVYRISILYLHDTDISKRYICLILSVLRSLSSSLHFDLVLKKDFLLYVLSRYGHQKIKDFFFAECAYVIDWQVEII